MEIFLSLISLNSQNAVGIKMDDFVKLYEMDIFRRQKFDPEEDDAIMTYVAKYGKQFGEIRSLAGNLIWKEMEKKKVSHSNRIKCRFFRSKSFIFFESFFQFPALLNHVFPMHPFSTPWKYQKTVRFSDVFRR